jgi:hypothetical protein
VLVASATHVEAPQSLFHNSIVSVSLSVGLMYAGNALDMGGARTREGVDHDKALSM